VDRYLRLMEELELNLVKAVDTHLHADHITGLGALRDRTQCTTVMGARSKVDVASIRVADPDQLRIEGTVHPKPDRPLPPTQSSASLGRMSASEIQPSLAKRRGWAQAAVAGVTVLRLTSTHSGPPAASRSSHSGSGLQSFVPAKDEGVPRFRQLTIVSQQFSPSGFLGDGAPQGAVTGDSSHVR
jgi:hypothetical protein